MGKKIIIQGTKIKHPLYVGERDRLELILSNAYPTLTIVVNNTSEGDATIDIVDRKNMDNRIEAAYSEFIERLLGRGVVQPESWEVTRSKYTEEMEHVQELYGLKQGDPDFLEWMLTLIGRSPIIIEDAKEE